MLSADKVIAREKKTAYRGSLTKITMDNNNNPIRYSDLIQPDDSIDKLIEKLEKVDQVYSKMADDISKKAEEIMDGLKDVSGATEEGRKATQRYADETAKLDKAERELQFAWSENGKELARLRLEKQEANRMNKLLIQRGKEEIDMTNLATKSYKELSAQYSINKIKLNQMSAEERKAAEANNQFVSTTRAIYEQMKKLQEETGKYQLNVGNYENAIKNAIGANNQFVTTLINLGKGGEEAKATMVAIQNGTKALGNTLLGLLKNPAFLAVAGIAGAAGAFKMWYDYNVGLQEATRLTREFTGMVGDDMKAFRNEVVAIADTFNLEFKPTLQAIDSVAANFGISFETAFKAVKDGLVAGADLNGDFLNKLQQYPAYFKEAGLSVEQFVAILTQTRSGIFGDKGLDAIKQANARIREMGTATAKALDDIGISSEQVTKDITSGVKTTFDVVQEVSAKLNELPDNSQAVGNALMDVFGKQGRDAGLAMIRSLKDISTDLEVVKAQTGEIGKMQEELAQANTELQNALSALFDFTGGTFERMTQGAKIFFVQGLTKIVTGIINVINYLRELYNDSVLVREVWNGVTGSFKLFYDTFSNGISFIIEAVKGLAIALEGIYTFDYKRALEGIERFGKAIPTLLSDVGESIGNAINEETEGLNKRFEPIRIPVSIGEQGSTVKNSLGGGASGQIKQLTDKVKEVKQKTDAELLAEEQKHQLDLLNAEKNYIAMRLQAVKKGSEEERELKELDIENERKIALLKNEQLAEGLRQQTEVINAVYDKKNEELVKSFADAELKLFDVDAKLAQSEFDLLEHTEEEKTKYKLQAERDRWQKVLELALKYGTDLSDAEVQTIKNTIQRLNDEIASYEQTGEKKDIYSLFGLSLDDKQKQAISQSMQFAMSQVNEWVGLMVQSAEKAVQNADRQVDAAQRVLEAEIQARANGYANNVEMAQKELDLAKKNQEKALKEQERAQKAQLAIQTIEQVSNLVTASSLIWSQLGFPLAIPALAVMWGSFALAKIKALQMTKQKESYGDGTVELLEGGSHQSGNDVDLGSKPDGTRRRAEGGEYFAVINKRNSRRYRALIPDIITSLNNGTFADRYMAANDVAGGLILNVNQRADIRELNDNVRQIRKQGESQRYVLSDGTLIVSYKNLTQKIR